MNWLFWTELMVRSAVLLGTGELLLQLSRNASAAMRHKLLLGCFMLLAVLPVMTVFLPEIPVSLWKPEHAVAGLVSVDQGQARVRDGALSNVVNWGLVIWISGFVVSMVPLSVGSFRARKMLRNAVPGNNEVLISDALPVPVTCGVLRPRIVLPVQAVNWNARRMRAVLLHERAHIRRHDLAVQLAVHFISALWWFQPMVWVLRRQLRAESEIACDAEVISRGLLPSEYAEELLGVARGADRAWKFAGSTIGMVRPGDLESRLAAVLRPGKMAIRRGRVWAIGLVLAASSVAASALNLNSEELGGSSMKRTVLSALLTSAGLTAGTVGGYLHDSKGEAIADAKVSIYGPANAGKQEVTTGADGKFDLNVEEGKYVLRIEKPGYTSIFKAFDLKMDAKMERDFTMSNEGSGTVADTAVGAGDTGSRHIPVGGQVAQENILTKVTPVYPIAAKKAAIQGEVKLAVTISQEGIPVDLRVISSPSDDLSASAIEAVSKWVYKPTLLNGNPVAVDTTVVVHYTLAK